MMNMGSESVDKVVCKNEASPLVAGVHTPLPLVTVQPDITTSNTFATFDAGSGHPPTRDHMGLLSFANVHRKKRMARHRRSSSALNNPPPPPSSSSSSSSSHVPVISQVQSFNNPLLPPRVSYNPLFISFLFFYICYLIYSALPIAMEI